MESMDTSEAAEVQQNSECPFTKLPTELKLEVFKYLGKKDLMSLTETCKVFDSVICDKLIDKLSVYFSDTKFTTDWKWIGSRSYTKIFFGNISNDTRRFHFASLIHDKDSVKILTFNPNQEIGNLAFNTLLRFFKNVQYLDLPGVSGFDVVSNPIQLALKELRCIHNLNGIVALRESTTQKVVLVPSNENNHPNCLAVFIGNQSNLKSLEIYFSNANNESYRTHDKLSIFKTNHLAENDFNLEELIIHNNVNLEKNETFCEFVAGQNSLASVKILGTKFASILNCFSENPNLKRLTVKNICDQTEFTFEAMPSVESLVWSNVKIDFNQIFPRLKTLEVIGVKGDINIEKLVCLKQLKFTNCTTGAATAIPLNVEMIQFDKHTFEAPLEFKDPTAIKWMILKNCGKVNWLYKFLNEKGVELRYFEIEDVELENALLAFIANNNGKINTLRSKNVKFTL